MKKKKCLQKGETKVYCYGLETVNGVETLWLSGKEKVLGAVVSMEVHAANSLGEISLIYWMTLIYILSSTDRLFCYIATLQYG